MTQEEKSAIQAEWLAEEDRLVADALFVTVMKAERIAQCAERVEVVPGWTLEELLAREG